MNYAYDSFETIENGLNSVTQVNNSSMRRGGDQYSHNGTNGHGPSHGSNGHMGGMGYGDTRSLQRPRNFSAQNDPRATYSLPRGSTSSSLPSYNAAVHENTPDFYYLPSQRKYSGEVVRVYVDYNQSK